MKQTFINYCGTLLLGKPAMSASWQEQPLTSIRNDRLGVLKS